MCTCFSLKHSPPSLPTVLLHRSFHFGFYWLYLNPNFYLESLDTKWDSVALLSHSQVCLYYWLNLRLRLIVSSADILYWKSILVVTTERNMVSTVKRPGILNFSSHRTKYSQSSNILWESWETLPSIWSLDSSTPLYFRAALWGIQDRWPECICFWLQFWLIVSDYFCIELLLRPNRFSNESNWRFYPWINPRQLCGLERVTTTLNQVFSFVKGGISVSFHCKVRLFKWGEVNNICGNKKIRK